MSVLSSVSPLDAPQGKRPRIAIVGSGISGLGAAWALRNTADIKVFEKDARVGGHSHTVDVDYNGTHIPVDTGFIVYNEVNYPNLSALFRTLNIQTIESNMTFGFSAERGRLEWQGNTIRSLFAQKRNLFKPSFHRMWMDMIRFRNVGLDDLKAGRVEGISLGHYLTLRGFSDGFRDNCVVPMGAAIWSSRGEDMLDFPAASFIRFFENHKLFHMDKPLWRTVKGGSREYVARLTASFRDRISTGLGAAQVTRNPHDVEIIDTKGTKHVFDHVILATHSDQALGLLTDPSEAERSVLSALRYAPNAVYLHRDPQLMPRRKSVWSSWNYLARHDGEDKDSVSVTYWMNRLQSIDNRYPLFISLNPPRPPRADLTFRTFEYDHPQFDAKGLMAQRRLPLLQGQRRTWFCGAYAGYGFHEDGLSSGLEVAARLGGSVPWNQSAPTRLSQMREAAE